MNKRKIGLTALPIISLFHMDDEPFSLITYVICQLQDSALGDSPLQSFF